MVDKLAIIMPNVILDHCSTIKRYTHSFIPVDGADKNIVTRPMKHIEKHTCIRFIEINPKSETCHHYVNFTYVSTEGYVCLCVSVCITSA